MKKVWKCDFCTHTDEEIAIVEAHEQECVFNPINKTCYTCKNKWYDGITTNEGCEKNLDIAEGEDTGNCKGWEERYKK